MSLTILMLVRYCHKCAFAAILNLEEAVDANTAAALARESAQDALTAALELRERLFSLRQQVGADNGGQEPVADKSQ